jgi:MFS family permease
MIVSFWMMGIEIIGLALTPSRATIGIAAPVLVVFFRMLQGFALGGEVGPTTAFLLELAPPERRGFFTAFQFWTQDLAILIAGLVGFSLANVLPEQQLQDFGWRIAFLVGAAIVPLGLVMRRSLPETFHTPPGGKSEHVPLRPYLPLALFGLMMLACSTIGAYIGDYMTTYAIATLHMTANIAFAATVVVGLSGVVFDLFTWAMSDRIGRKPMMIIPGVLLLALILPGFYLISHHPTMIVFLATIAVQASLAAMSAGPAVVWLTESLPASIRSGSVAVIYAVSIATFGGSTQFAVTWLIKTTGNPMAPAWYWMAAMCVGLVAMCSVHESAPRRVAEMDARRTGTLG